MLSFVARLLKIHVEAERVQQLLLGQMFEARLITFDYDIIERLLDPLSLLTLFLDGAFEDEERKIVA